MCNYLKRAWAEIDLDALEHNYNAIKSISAGKDILAVVKANAYGHDDKTVCKKLSDMGVRYFGVSNLWEAENLRKCGITGTILTFGYTDPDYFDELVEYGITQTAGSVGYASALSEYALKKGVKIPVHIKTDTGMSRVGIDTEDEFEKILSMKGLSCEGIYTHFSSADSLEDDDTAYTRAQQDKLLKIAGDSGLKLHSQNSGGILYYPKFGGDIVRAGIILYGHSPNYPLKMPIDVKSVMTVKSVISQIKEISAGTQVSYGRTYTAQKSIRAAVVPIGYADGYFRGFSSKGKMLVNGVLCPVIGRVCMDQTIIDISDAGGARVGDTVYVYSDKARETGIDYNASLLGTIGYELLCAVALRMPRVIISGGSIQEVVRYGNTAENRH